MIKDTTSNCKPPVQHYRKSVNFMKMKFVPFTPLEIRAPLGTSVLWLQHIVIKINEDTCALCSWIKSCTCALTRVFRDLLGYELLVSLVQLIQIDTVQLAVTQPVQEAVHLAHQLDAARIHEGEKQIK